jgi:hypothetical protein
MDGFGEHGVDAVTVAGFETPAQSDRHTQFSSAVQDQAEHGGGAPRRGA